MRWIRYLHNTVRAIELSQWKRQLFDGARELFTEGKQDKDKEEG